MINNNDLVTIIVPIYNVEKYLKRCVDSILNQTYDNLEIILVDDGSPDNCGNICEEYATKDKRVKVIHKKNEGVSEARNIAISKSNGNYITFVDSDDVIAKDYVEYLHNLVIEFSADISLCSFAKFSTNIKKEDMNENIEIFSSEQALENLFYQKNILTSCWGKLYNKKVFDGLTFPKGINVGEDLATIYKTFANSKKIVVSHSIKYFYFYRQSSAINSKFDVKRVDSLKFASEMVEFAKIKFPKLIMAAYNRLFMEAVFIMIKIPRNKYKREKNMVYNIIKENRKKVILDKNSKMVYRFIAFISFFGIVPIKLLFYVKSKLEGNNA